MQGNGMHHVTDAFDLARSIESELGDSKNRIEELEEALSDIYHSTSCTASQMNLIEEVIPQKIESKSERPPESGWKHEPGLMG